MGRGRVVEGFIGYVEDLAMDSMGVCRVWGGGDGHGFESSGCFEVY